MKRVLAIFGLMAALGSTFPYGMAQTVDQTATTTAVMSGHTHELRAVPAALVVAPTASNELVIRSFSASEHSGAITPNCDGRNPAQFRYCIVIGNECHHLPTHTQAFNNRRLNLDSDPSLLSVRASAPASVLKKLSKVTASLPQGTPLSTVIKAIDKDGSVVAEIPFNLFGSVKNTSFRSKGRSNRRKQSRSKSARPVSIFTTGTSAQRPSRSYTSPPGFNGDGCSGLDAVFPSYKAYLDCADAAVTQCTQRDASSRAFCIYERCRNTPDQFESFWRTLDGDTKSVGNSYYKNNFGSSTLGEDRFEVALHPCLYDGAGQFTTKFNSSAVVMGDVYPLTNSFLQVFHPAKTENENLSRGDARLSFNGQLLTRIVRDDFGATTVPFSYQQELFKSFPQTQSADDKVYWVNGTIPVYMYFRPQGVIGLELEVRVSPEARFLEVDFKSYADFGTSTDVGPARDGVRSITREGLLSLIQAEYRTSKYISLNATENEMLPSLAELSQLEFWPSRGKFGPICAQWFKSETTHPVVGFKCSTQVDFGTLQTRQGTVSTARDGRDRLIYYRDFSSGGDGGELKPYPWRNPVLDDQ